MEAKGTKAAAELVRVVIMVSFIMLVVGVGI
jgi:hypothetical protein